MCVRTLLSTAAAGKTTHIHTFSLDKALFLCSVPFYTLYSADVKHTTSPLHLRLHAVGYTVVTKITKLS